MTFDEIHLELAKRVGDPVAAVGTAGAKYSSAQRLVALNEGIRRFIIKAAMARKEGALASYITTDSQALANNVKALSGFSGGAMGDGILSAYNTTDSVIVHRLPPELEAQTRTGGNQFLTASTTNQFFIIDAGNFKLLDGSTTTSDTIALRYVKQHTDLVAGGTILIPSEFHPQIIDLAEAVLIHMDGSSESFAKSQLLDDKVTREIG